MLRLRLERPYLPGTLRAVRDASRPSSRVHLRIEHVNTGAVSQHRTIDMALDWLRQRLAALVHASAGPADPEGDPPPPRP